MKRIFGLLILLVLVINVFSADLLPVSQRGKWGFIDNTGKVVIKPQFKFAANFSEGLAPVKFRNNKWGYIDEIGNTVIDGKYLSATTFSEGFGIVQTAPRGAAYNFIDKTGNLLLEKNVGDAKDFSEGLAPVMIASGEWVYVDNTGKTVISNGELGYFRSAGMFNEGIAPVFSGDGNAPATWHYAYIDKTGKEVLTLDRSTTMAVGRFSEGLAPVMINRKWGYYNLQGELVIPAHYAMAMPFTNGYAAAIYEPGDNYKGWTVIDKTGKPVFDKTFNRVITGYLGVYGNAYIDTMNRIDNLSRNLAMKLTGGRGLLNFNSIMLIEPGTHGIHSFELADGLLPIIVKVNKAKYRGNIPAAVYGELPKNPNQFYNYINLKGEKLNKENWISASPFKNGIARVYTKQDTFGYIDTTGKYIWKPQK